MTTRNQKHAYQHSSTRFRCKLHVKQPHSVSYHILISCSKSKSGREKRSQRETYFQPSDIVIPGISSVGENTLKVEFAVLFPAVNGEAPEPSLPVEITQMLYKKKETIQKAIGATIKEVTAEPSVKPSKKSNFALFFKK